MVTPAKVEVGEAGFFVCADTKEYQKLLPQQPVMAKDRKTTVHFLLRAHNQALLGAAHLPAMCAPRGTMEKPRSIWSGTSAAQ